MRAYEFDRATKTIPGLDFTELKARGVLSLSGFSGAVIDELREGMLYKDRYDGVDTVLREVDATTGTVYIADEFIDSIERQVAGATVDIAEQRVLNHRGMLNNHRKIYAGTNGATDWYQLTAAGSDVIDQASETLSHVDPEQICSRSWVDLVLGTEDEKEIVEAPFFENYADELALHSRTLRGLIPVEFLEIAHAQTIGRNIIVANSLGAQPLPATNDQVGMILRSIEQSSWTDDKLQRKIERQAGRIAVLLHRIRTEPDKLYAEGMMNSYNKLISELVKGFVDLSIAEQHNEYFTPATKKQKRNKRMLEYANRQAAIDGPATIGATADITTETEIATTPTAEMELTGTLEDLGTVELTFPWMTEESSYPVKKIRGSSNNVYVVHAQEPKVAQISSEVKTGLTKNEDGLDVFDQTILHRARTLASGIMPFLDPSVKRIKNKPSDMREGYRKTTIWYSFDISPNAPRVYFTVKPAPKHIGDDIGENDLMLVVLGETDKAHQIDVLKRFTNKSHRALVQQGAGSV